MAKEQKNQEKPKPKQPVEEEHETLIRILSYDIPGSKKLYVGLTFIKGISWAISKAICTKLALPFSKKISELSNDEIKKIEEFLDKPDIPHFLKNRRFDPETGESKHLQGTDLDLQKEFDIKHMRKIRSYKGIRHGAKLPVRGQRTRSHFRSRGRTVGVKRKAK